jgi:hypothetical protein
MNASWPIECFRPLDQRETDISSLKKILDQTPTVTPALSE